ncbi:MAG: universal stress protein [Gemmatimonadaceae bacterium]
MSNSLRQNAPVNDTILVSETCACASPKHPILLATDGSTLAESAVRVGAALAQRADAGALAVSAVLPIPACAFAPDGSILSVVSAESEEHERWVRGDGIADQLRRAAVPSEWPVFVDTGDATDVIIGRANETSASLIVMGLRAHGSSDRVSRDETTLRVMREARVPVLGVIQLLHDLPKNIVVAIDFSRASLRAARVALSVAGAGASVTLVCVQPECANVSEELEGRQLYLIQGLEAAFVRLRKVLSPLSDVTIESAVLEGAAAPEILSFAERIGADLVAIGSRRRGLRSRVALGSVTSKVVRAAQCSVLVVPPGATDRS